MKTSACFVLCLFFAAFSCRFPARQSAPPADRFQVIAYYHGNGADLNRYRFDRISQVIFSFCHLKGNRMAVDNASDSLAVARLVALKQTHPRLKVILSLGGWCGCKTCSDIFADPAGRAEFSASVLQLLQYFHADGLDLDWEYPAISGCPGHPFVEADRHNFTLLIRTLRRTLGRRYELSFAAGGFPEFFDQAVEWDSVMPLLNRVNLMSYDIVNGFSTRTGHHSSLFSTPEQPVSVDFGVKRLVELGVPRSKIVIGAAFYARTWEQVAEQNRGLYQSGVFKSYVPYRRMDQLSAANGFMYYRDSIARAPYAYSAARKEFATFDDPISLAWKTMYARNEKLGGIMFWELSSDADDGALLQAIDGVLKE